MAQSVLIVGGSGKVARQLTTLLTTQTPPWTVHSLVRSQQHIPSLTSLGATPHIHSIEDSSTSSLSNFITSLQPKPTAVIFSAGAGGGSPERTRKVDQEGAITAMDAAAEAGVKRFIMVSAVDVRDRKNKAVPEWYNDEDKERSEGMVKALGPYMDAKLAADHSLVTENERRKLDWTIVRPGRLAEGEATGKIRAGRVSIAGEIRRADVAGVVARCLVDDGTVGLAFDVLNGDEGVNEAIGRVGKERIDCFEGYH